MNKSVFIPLISAIIGGVITASANIYINFRQEDQKITLQKQQFESELILRAIIPDNIEQSKKNIDLLVKASFISKENEVIEKINGNDSLLKIRLEPSRDKKGGDRPELSPPNG